MELYCDDHPWGLLTQYTYATPWAEAKLRPADEAVFATLCRVSHFLTTILEESGNDLTETEEEAEYERHLAQLELSESDVDRFHGSHWEIRSDHPHRQGTITLYEANPDGWIRWRWS